MQPGGEVPHLRIGVGEYLETAGSPTIAGSTGTEYHGRLTVGQPMATASLQVVYLQLL